MSSVTDVGSGSLAANQERVAKLLDGDWPLLIGGELTPAESGRTFEVSSPCREQVIARVPDGSATDARRAVGSAQAAFADWAAMPATTRAELVNRLADALEERGHDLALLDAVDGGAPVIRRAHRVGRALETGYVWINGAGEHFTGMPFGGWKDSGVGHEEAIEELLSDTRIKSVNVML